MSITEKDRLDLRQKLDEVLGNRLAAIAMEAMPPLDYDQFATKTDVQNLGTALRGEIATSKADLRVEIADLRAEMVQGFAAISADMGKQFRQYFFANVAVMLTMLGFVVGLT